MPVIRNLKNCFNNNFPLKIPGLLYENFVKIKV
jgi:hypothetical protein